MRARWNETSLAILANLSMNPGTTAKKIAKDVGKKHTSVSTILKRLFECGAVSRVRVVAGEVVLDKELSISRDKYVFHFFITDKGRGRLAMAVAKNQKDLLMSSS